MAAADLESGMAQKCMAHDSSAGCAGVLLAEVQADKPRESHTLCIREISASVLSLSQR